MRVTYFAYFVEGLDDVETIAELAWIARWRAFRGSVSLCQPRPRAPSPGVCLPCASFER